MTVRSWQPLSLTIATLAVLACSGVATPDRPEVAAEGEGGAEAEGEEARGEAPEAPGGCDVSVYVTDPDPKGLNVRDAPKGQILGQLPKDTEVVLREARDGWMRFTGPAHPEADGLPEGWVHPSLLGTSLKTPMDYGPDMQPVLHLAPREGAASRPIPLDRDPKVKILGCQGRWLKVEIPLSSGRPLHGWLGLDSHCPSPWTTCS